MPSFQVSKDALIWESTAISNAFLSEYLPYAPENYVKVYLYACMLSRFTTEEGSGLIVDVSNALEMSDAEVTQALRYWERCRLVERIKDDPPEYRFVSASRIVCENLDLPVDTAYAQFSQSLYQLFSDTKRKLHGAEIQAAYEWVEDLALLPEHVTMLIQHMKDVHGVNFSFKTARKLAEEMQARGIKSMDAAEGFFESKEVRFVNTKAILSKLGIRSREPSDPEMAAYDRWTGEWGFTKEGILLACDETLAAQNPSFAYLDKILSAKRQEGKITVQELKAGFADARQESDLVREILQELGISQDVVGEGDRLVYRDIARYGHELALIATREVKLHCKAPRLDRVQELINSWEGKNLTTPEKIKAYLDEIAIVDSRLKQLNTHLKKSFLNRNESTRQSFRKWCSELGMGMELIELAADYAAEADRPALFMDKLLTDWQQKGIRTPEAAKADHEAFAREHAGGKAAANAPKKVNAQNYNQRTDDIMDDERLTAREIEDIERYGL